MSDSYIATPTAFQGSRIAWNSGWDLKLRDGTLYRFPDSSSATRPQQAAVTSIQDRYGNTLTLERDSNKNLTKITSPKGRWISLTIDGSHRITKAWDNIGRVVTYTYDGSGRLTAVKDPAGGLTEYTYDPLHRMLTLKDAKAIVFLTNEYDATGRVSRQTQADGTTFQFAYTLGARSPRPT